MSKDSITMKNDNPKYTADRMLQLKEAFEESDGFMFAWKHKRIGALGVLSIGMGPMEIASVMAEIDADYHGIIGSMMEIQREASKDEDRKQRRVPVTKSDSVKEMVDKFIDDVKDGKITNRGKPIESGDDEAKGVNTEDWR